MILLPLWEGWDGACSGWDGAVVFWMGLWWNSFPLGKDGMGLVVVWMGLWWNSFPLGKVGMGLLCWMVRTSEPPLLFRGTHRHAGDLRFGIAAADVLSNDPYLEFPIRSSRSLG